MTILPLPPEVEQFIAMVVLYALRCFLATVIAAWLLALLIKLVTYRSKS